MTFGVVLRAGEILTADFENFDEGPVGACCEMPFYDPESGFYFFDAVTQSGTVDFFIDDRGATSFLSGGAYVPGPDAWLGADFGFQATLGVSAVSVSIDVLYASIFGGELSLVGYGSQGQVVATETVGLVGIFLETSLTIETTGARIVGIELVADGVAAAYDNVSVAVVGAGDCDADGDVDLDDLAGFVACGTGPDGDRAEGACGCFDMNGDGFISVLDWGAMQIAFDG
jgi:hypothetical protein